MAKVYNMAGGGGGGIKLASIAITTPPVKTSYRPGETFSPAGMVVTATYSNWATAIATGYTFTPSTPLQLGDTEVTIQYTEQGVTKTAEQAVSVANEPVPVPAQSGTLTYTGSAQSPTWTGYNAAKMTIGGTTSATDAGNYTATFTPKTGYCWPDNTTGAKNVSWSIAKASGSVTLSAASVTLDPSHTSRTVDVTRLGNGAISASSSNTSVATVSVNGTTVTISSVGSASGNATITVTAAESDNYNAASATVSVSAQFVSIYGVSWDGSSTTKWTRTDDAAGFTDPVPYTAGKTAAQCSSPFDNRLPWSGMVKSTRTGGVMVAIPKFWYKLTKNGNGLKIQIADGATEGFSVSPAHMNRGDGKGERDVVYVGRYHCSGSDFKSNTMHAPMLNVTRANFRTSIHNLGSNIWQADFALRFTIWLLYLVEFADWNTQKTIGKGCGNNSAAQSMGYTDSMPYHTGTTQSNRDTYGLGTQYRNIEGLWDNCYDFCDGCYNNSNGLNIILNPNSFSDTSGGTSVGTPTSGWPSAFNVVNQAGFPMIIPSASSGGENVASCDNWNFNTGNPVIFVGGDYYRSGSHGLFFVNYTSVTDAHANRGSRLQELP